MPKSGVAAGQEDAADCEPHRQHTDVFVRLSFSQGLSGRVTWFAWTHTHTHTHGASFDVRWKPNMCGVPRIFRGRRPSTAAQKDKAHGGRCYTT